MRNQFETECAKCGDTLEPDDGTVLTRGRRSPYPVICDLCIHEVDEMERAALEQD